MPLDEAMHADLTDRGDRPDATLTELVRAVGERRDRLAFAALFRHFAPRLKAFMRRLGSSDDQAEELVQETMLMVWRRAESFDPTRASVQTWLYQIARNKRIDSFRRSARPDFDPHDPALVPDPEPSPVERLETAQSAEQLRVAIKALPSEQADILHMAYFDHRSQSEIGLALGLPLGTVKSRTRLALERLRKHLSDTDKQP
jgi:RNA polymerase sigma factor (sigma-70 family)